MLEKIKQFLSVPKGVNVEGPRDLCYFVGNLAEERLKYDNVSHKWVVVPEVDAIAKAAMEAFCKGQVQLFQSRMPGLKGMKSKFAYFMRRR